MFVRVEDSSQVNLRKDYPHISWANDLDTIPDDLLPEGVARVVKTEPYYTMEYEYSVVDGYDLVDGKAHEVWGIIEWSLEDAKADKIAKLSQQCQEEIYKGFEYDGRHYSSKDKDQVNLIASVTDALMNIDTPGWITYFWCEDNGVWEMREHTAQEIMQVGKAGKSSIQNSVVKNELLAQTVMEARNLAEVRAVVW